MAGGADARLHGADFPRLGAHARVRTGQVEAGRRVALRDGRQLLADAQVQRVQYVVARFDLGDEVPAHLLQVGLDHAPRARQRAVDPLLEGGLPILHRPTVALDITGLPLPGDERVRLEDLVEGQGRTARAAGFLPVHCAQRRRSGRRLHALPQIAVDLARHDRLHGFEGLQRRHAMPGEFRAAGKRQQPETQVADGLERLVAQLRLAAQRHDPIQCRCAQRAQFPQHPQAGKRLEQHTNMAGVRAFEAFGMQLEMDAQPLQDAPGPLELLAFILDQARERVTDLGHVRDIELSPWVADPPQQGGQLPESPHGFRLALPLRQRIQCVRQVLRAVRRLQCGVRDQPAGEFAGRQPRAVFARPFGECAQGIAHALRIHVVQQRRFGGDALSQLQRELRCPVLIGPFAQGKQCIGGTPRIQGSPSAVGLRRQVRYQHACGVPGPRFVRPSAQRAQRIGELLMIHGLEQPGLGRHAIRQLHGDLLRGVLLGPLAQRIQHGGDALRLQRLPQLGLRHETRGQLHRCPAHLRFVGPFGQCTQTIGELQGTQLTTQLRLRLQASGQQQRRPLRALGARPLAQRVQRIGNLRRPHGRQQFGLRRNARSELQRDVLHRVFARPFAQGIQRAAEFLRFQCPSQRRVGGQTVRQQKGRPKRPRFAGPLAQRAQRVGDALRLQRLQ